MQTPFDTDLLDDAAGDELDTDLADSEGFEDDALDALDEGDDSEAFDEFDDDSFDGEGLDDDSMSADSLDDAGDELDAFSEGDDELDLAADLDAGDGFEDSAMDDEALVDAFSDALDADDEEQFVGAAIRRLRRAARTPLVRRLLQVPMPAALSLVRHAAPRLSRGIGQLRGILGSLSMDAFADLAADYGDEAMDAFAPVTAAMGAFRVARALRQRQPGRLPRPLARGIMRASLSVARALSQRVGPNAMRIVPHVLRATAGLIARGRVRPRQVPQVIRRAAQRVVRSPAAMRRLAQPNPAARRLRARARLVVRRPGAATAGPRPMTARPSLRPPLARRYFRPVPGRPGTFDIRGPVRLQFRR